MGFFSSITNFLAKPIVGTIGSIATGLWVRRVRMIGTNNKWP